jgi:hypothetical protein
MFCNGSKRRWKPKGATSTQPSTTNEAVTVPQAVRRPDGTSCPGAGRGVARALLPAIDRHQVHKRRPGRTPRVPASEF